MIFKYTSFRREFFDNRMLRFTKPNLFNDPFEGQVNNAQLSQYFRKICPDLPMVDELIKEEGLPYENLGIISLSKNMNNILMWSHYAQNHTGMMIALDETNGLFEKNIKSNLKYDAIQCDVEYSNFRLDSKFRFSEYPISLTRKSLDWAYEKEFRIFLSKDSADVINNDIWLKQVDKSKIKAIVFGAKIKREEALDTYIDAIIHDKFNPNTELYFASMSDRFFAIDYIEFSKTDEIKQLFKTQYWSETCLLLGTDNRNRLIKEKMNKEYYLTYEALINS